MDLNCITFNIYIQKKKKKSISCNAWNKSIKHINIFSHYFDSLLIRALSNSNTKKNNNAKITN